MGFQKPNASVKPTVACLGYLGALEDAHKSQNSDYSVMPFEIKGRYGSFDIKGNIVFLPEWFEPNFNPLVLDSKSQNTYRMNIAGPDDRTLANLQGLCGSAEHFEALGEAKDGLQEYTMESLSEFLQGYFGGLQNVEIGYILKQKTEKVDGQKRATNFYEVGSWFYPTEEAIARLIEREAKSIEKPGKGAPFRIGFDLKAAGVVVSS